MRITKIKIKNLFGISETELDGRNIELSGSNGTGKTSVIDAIRYALTNQSDRDYIIRNGEKEGEILIEAVTNLSEGEKLELCVDVALSKPNSLQVILIDGVERLSDSNRDRLYAKCKEKGLQFIATRTTNSDELEINYL